MATTDQRENAAKSASQQPNKRHVSATDRVYASLKEMILSTEFEPESILIEHELADQFGVSKTPVRDALRLLVHEGWVTVIPRRGYLVRALRLDDVSELFGLRQMIEPTLAGLAAERGTTTEKAELAELVKLQQDASDVETAFNAGADFHRKIAQMARNSRAEAVLDNLLEELYRIRRMAPWLDTRLQEPDEFAGHASILNAIQAGDVALAHQKMDEHSRESLRKKVQGLGSLI